MDGPKTAPRSFPLTAENCLVKKRKFKEAWVEWYDLCFVFPTRSKDDSKIIQPSAALDLVRRICVPQPYDSSSEAHADDAEGHAFFPSSNSPQDSTPATAAPPFVQTPSSSSEAPAAAAAAADVELGLGRAIPPQGRSTTVVTSYCTVTPKRSKTRRRYKLGEAAASSPASPAGTADYSSAGGRADYSARRADNSAGQPAEPSANDSARRPTEPSSPSLDFGRQFQTSPEHGAEPPPANLPSGRGLDSWVTNEPITLKEFRARMKGLFLEFLDSANCYVEEVAVGPHVFLKVRLSDEAARDVALRTDFVLQMDRSAVRSEWLRKHKLFVPPYAEFDDFAESSGSGHGYACMEWSDRVWARYDACGRLVDGIRPHSLNDPELSLFKPIDRVRLFLDVLERHWWLDGMKSTGILEDYFFLQQPLDILRLRRDWGNFRLLLKTWQPTPHLRNYYGEKLTLYFCWLGFFTKQLRWISLLGIVVFAVQVISDPGARFSAGISNTASIVFSICVSVWAAHFLDAWRRLEDLVMVRWGLHGHTVKPPVIRKQFKEDRFVADEIQRNVLQKEAYWWKQWLRRILSFGVTVSVMLLDLACIGGLYSLTYFSKQQPDRFTWARGQVSWVISLGCTVIIYIFDTLWGYLCPVLTNFENWRFESGHEASYITKVFVFRMMNNFASLVFVAFIKDYYDPCGPREDGGCIPQLRLNLITQFFIRMSLNVVEVGWPFATALLAQHVLKRQIAPSDTYAQEARKADAVNGEEVKEAAGPQAGPLPGQSSKPGPLPSSPLPTSPASPADSAELADGPPPGTPSLSSLQLEFSKPAYNLLNSLIDDYMEVMISFAYVVVFSIIVPVIPALTWLLNLVELRSDAFKMIFCFRRTVPSSSELGAEGMMRTWRQLLFGLSCAAIAINVAMSFFVIGIGFGVELSLSWKLIFFVIGEHIVLLTPWLLSFATMDATGELVSQLRLMRAARKDAVWGDRGNYDALDELQKAPMVAVKDCTPAAAQNNAANAKTAGIVVTTLEEFAQDDEKKF